MAHGCSCNNAYNQLYVQQSHLNKPLLPVIPPFPTCLSPFISFPLPYPVYLYNSTAHIFAVISLTITDPHSLLHSHTNTLPFSLSPPITLTPPHSPSPSHSLTHTTFFLDRLLTPMSFPGSPPPFAFILLLSFNPHSHPHPIPKSTLLTLTLTLLTSTLESLRKLIRTLADDPATKSR